MVLPSGPELFFGAMLFALVVVAITAAVLLLLRRRSSSHAELDEWRERAIRAEAERDLLRDRASDS